MDKRNRTNTNTSTSSTLSNKFFKQVVAATTTASISNPISSNSQTNDSDNIDEAFNLPRFDDANFEVDSYVKKIAFESLDANNLLKTRDKLTKIAEKTAEEIKQSVYNNYTNFMETAKEVGHLEGKMYKKNF